MSLPEVSSGCLRDGPVFFNGLLYVAAAGPNLDLADGGDGAGVVVDIGLIIRLNTPLLCRAFVALLFR